MAILSAVGLSVLYFLSSLIWASHVSAHKGAMGVVKERMKLMTRMEKRLRPLARMAQDKRPFEKTLVQERAQELLAITQKFPHLFPKGSHAHPSEAKAEIWENWPTFLQRFRDFEKQVKNLLTADKATFQPRYQAVMKSCNSCHKTFREERE